jgi:LPXTG-motif cell wall-anchored protein
VPIVGGYLLDGRLHTSPWLTLLGLVFASAGVFGVLKRIVSEADRRVAGDAKPKGRS